jgi:uroporphyrinogen decarboxylase
MRQAGRSLPEYNAARGTGSILDAVQHPDLVAELTMQPVRRYGVDAAVLYSDIMVPLFAMGFGVDIVQGTGPVVAEPFESEADLTRLEGYDPAEHSPYVGEAIELLVEELDIPLIGFSGAPFTLAAYLIEGGPSRQFAKTKALMHSNSVLWHRLMDALVNICTKSLSAQVEAGVSAVQVFDSWAGALSPDDYSNFVMGHTNQLLANLADSKAFRVNFGTGTGAFLHSMTAEADVIGIDWRIRIDEARKAVGNKTIQGNLDPAICLAGWPAVEAGARKVLTEAGPDRHIFNLGHGVLPQTDPDVLARLTEFVQGYKHDS